MCGPPPSPPTTLPVPQGTGRGGGQGPCLFTMLCAGVDMARPPLFICRIYGSSSAKKSSKQLFCPSSRGTYRDFLEFQGKGLLEDAFFNEHGALMMYFVQSQIPSQSTLCGLVVVVLVAVGFEQPRNYRHGIMFIAFCVSKVCLLGE